MSAIDPTSPRRFGYDTSGVLRRLGDTDSDGVFIGYICEEGTVWESRLERDVAVTAGRFMDAWNEWNRAGGVLGVEPDPIEFADRIAAPDNWLPAVTAAEDWLAEYMPGGMIREDAIRHRAAAAALN